MMMTKNQKLFQKLLVFGFLSFFLIWGFEDLAYTKTEYVKYSDPKRTIKGDGSLGNPYQIAHPYHLELVKKHLTSHFKLTQNLDLGEEENFKPIGSFKKPFTGTFNGRGKIIRNLKIKRPNEYGVGFFGQTQGGSVIRDVRLEKIRIQGKWWVGGLVGVNVDQKIIEGLLDAVEKFDAGERKIFKEFNDIFVRRNRYGGKVMGSYAKGQVMGYYGVGGLVGWNDGHIEASHAAGKVEGKEKKYLIGGLVGVNVGIIETSYATGHVEGIGSVGGLVGENAGKGKIESSYAMGLIEGKNYLGGLVGSNGGIIKTSYATGEVVGNGYGIGGFVGSNGGMIQTSYATGEVVGNDSAGGLVGLNGGTIEGSYATGKVLGKKDIGGLVGYNHEKGRIEGKNYWSKGLVPEEGIGENNGKVFKIRSKSKSQIYALIRKAWKNQKIWTFPPGKHPELRWQSSSRSSRSSR